jgi:hypothetical protein
MAWMATSAVKRYFIVEFVFVKRVFLSFVFVVDVLIPSVSFAATLKETGMWFL